MLNERKLTERELDHREVVLQNLLKNKRNLVKRYGKDAEKVMYGIATKKAKSKIEGMNKEKIKELIRTQLEGIDSSPRSNTDDIDANKSYSGGADYGSEVSATSAEDSVEQGETQPLHYSLEEGHGLDQGDIDVLKYMISQLKSGGDLSMDVGARKKMVKVLTFLIKSNIIQDKTKDLSKDKIEEENISLDEVGYNDGEQAVAMHFNQDVVGINNESDFKQYKKGFIQAVVDETQSYALEEMDVNDPVLMKLRAAAAKKDRQEKAKSRISYEDAMDLRLTLSQLEDSRDRLVRDMEQEAEPEGGPIADRYGDELNKLEDRIDSIRKKINDYDMNESAVTESKGAKNYFDDLKFNYQKAFRYLDADEKEEYKQLAKNYFSQLKEGLDEKISSLVKEKLTKSSSVEDHIEDFKDSDAPQFKGKSLKKIKQMALASFLSKQGKKKVAEGFKVGQEVTYLGHPGEITLVDKDVMDRVFYNVSYDKGNGKTKVSNIYNKGGEIKAV
jgi:hypothetical protein